MLHRRLVIEQRERAVERTQGAFEKAYRHRVVAEIERRRSFRLGRSVHVRVRLQGAIH